MIQSNPKSRWWAEPAWWLYERLPAVADNVLKWRLPYILPFKNLRIPIAILRGSTRGNRNQGTLLVAGDEHKIEYMSHRFFEGNPQRELLGKVPLWTLTRTLKRLRPSVDMTIVRVDRLTARLFFGEDYLAVPEWVGSMLTIPEDSRKLVKGSRNLKQDLRVVRRNNLYPEVTHAETDFEMFYHTMYVPFIRNRHGEHALIRDIHRSRRMFRQGGLQWIRCNGRPIAGRIFQRRDHVLKFVAQGTVNGEWSPVKEGAIAALYFFGIDHAKKLGCKLIDLGVSRPSLNDGVLRYKRKWGVTVVENGDIYYDFLLCWNRLNKAVASFLSNTPLIFRDHDGLSAISVLDQNEPETQNDAWKISHSMWMPGLQRLYLVATSGWQPVHDSPPQTTLIDLIDVGDCNPRMLQALGSK